MYHLEKSNIHLRKEGQEVRKVRKKHRNIAYILGVMAMLCVILGIIRFTGAGTGNLKGNIESELGFWEDLLRRKGRALSRTEISGSSS